MKQMCESEELHIGERLTLHNKPHWLTLNELPMPERENLIKTRARKDLIQRRLNRSHLGQAMKYTWEQDSES